MSSTAAGRIGAKGRERTLYVHIMQGPSGRGYAQRWDVSFGEFAFHARG